MPRSAVPAPLAPAAVVEGVKLARFWGDKPGADIRAAVALQYEQTRRAVLSGKRPAQALQRADFLAISGGGADGAFSAGFLSGWSRRGGRPAFEVVTGVSTGALAAPFAFLGPRHDRELAEVFTAYGDRDIYVDRGVVGLVSNGLYDNAPLRRLIARYMSDELIDAIAHEYGIGRRLLIQTTNIDAQRPVIWDLTAIAASNRPDRRDRMIDILLASAALPAIFPPVRLDVLADGVPHQELHVDGATVSQVFFAPPDLRLSDYEKRYFGQPRARTLYLIRNGRLGPEYAETQETTIGVARRAIETLVKYQTVADLTRLQSQARAANGTIYFAAIPPSFGLMPRSEFDQAYMRQLFKVGRDEGEAGRWQSQAPRTPASAH
ncbi:patatin-like phospholipase family protein [Bosea sp. 2KB_26]|uniref:patatin-like phospholipase family protein n=1 Tax=Bosea sp. 2KB_26 TaxID=3237475 RepID=UPI003F934BE0